MNVIIRTIDVVIFSGVAQEISLPGLHGNVGIRAHHAPMSIVLSNGEIRVQLENKQESFLVQSGIAHVANNTLDVLLAA